MSDMIEITTREFTRKFSEYRARSAHGEVIHIKAPDGLFVFARITQGLTGENLLKRISSRYAKAIFDSDGGKNIEAARKSSKRARSPWE